MSTEPVEGTVGTMTWAKGGQSVTLPIGASAEELHAALARLDIKINASTAVPDNPTH